MDYIRARRELSALYCDSRRLIITFTVSQRGESTVQAPRCRGWEPQMWTVDVEDEKFELWSYIKTLLHDLYAFVVLLCSGSLNGVNKENIHKTALCQPSRFPHRNLTRHSSSFNLCQDLLRALGSSANSLQRTEIEGGWRGGIGRWMTLKLFLKAKYSKVYLHSCTFHLILWCKPFLS